MSLTKIFDFDTIYPADSVEWCPIVEFTNLFVCGTYLLKEDDDAQERNNQRIGRLYLFCLKESLCLLETKETSGILDIKWAEYKINNIIVLAIAHANGEVAVYRLKESEPSLELEYKFMLSSENILALSLNWGLPGTNQLAVSDSEGCLTLLRLTSEGLTREFKIKAHDFEAWIVAFDYWNPCVLYSGGDDSKLKVFDSREQRVTSVCKEHSSGVTSIISNPKSEYNLTTGSYDENIRVWDTRNMKSCRDSIETGGGVWRLKYDPFDGKILLAACMYNGFSAFGSEPLSLLSEFKEHESIAYGADWSYTCSSQFRNVCGNNDRGYLASFCSFYDHRLSIVLAQFCK